MTWSELSNELGQTHQFVKQAKLEPLNLSSSS